MDTCESCPWEILDELESKICYKMLYERKDLQSIFIELKLKSMQGQRIFHNMLKKIYERQKPIDDDLPIEDDEEFKKVITEISELAEKVERLKYEKWKKENYENTQKKN